MNTMKDAAQKDRERKQELLRNGEELRKRMQKQFDELEYEEYQDIYGDKQ